MVAGSPELRQQWLSLSYVTLMQTRLSAADVQPGSVGLLSHWRQRTAAKPFNAHSEVAVAAVMEGGQDASLWAVHQNVRRDGGVGMKKEAD